MFRNIRPNCFDNSQLQLCFYKVSTAFTYVIQTKQNEFRLGCDDRFYKSVLYYALHCITTNSRESKREAWPCPSWCWAGKFTCFSARHQWRVNSRSGSNQSLQPLHSDTHSASCVWELRSGADSSPISQLTYFNWRGDKNTLCLRARAQTEELAKLQQVT